MEGHEDMEESTRQSTARLRGGHTRRSILPCEETNHDLPWAFRPWRSLPSDPDRRVNRPGG